MENEVKKNTVMKSIQKTTLQRLSRWLLKLPQKLHHKWFDKDHDIILGYQLYFVAWKGSET